MSVETAPNIGVVRGGLGSFGVEMSGPLSTPIVEGPARGFSLENTAPLVLGQQPNVLNEVSVISEAEAILSQARNTSVPEVFYQAWKESSVEPVEPPRVVDRVGARSLLVWMAAKTFFPIPLEILTTPAKAESNPIKVEQPALKTEIKTNPDAGFHINTEAVLITQTRSEAATHEVLEIEEFEDLEKERKIAEPKSEKEKLKTSHSIDKRIFQKRVEQIKEAGFQAAEAESGKKIPGWRVFRFLSSLLHRDFRGQDIEILDPNGRLVDGTWEANLENVRNEEFTSKKDVAEKAPVIVALDKPVAKGGGEPISPKDIATTYKYAKSKIHKVDELVEDHA